MTGSAGPLEPQVAFVACGGSARGAGPRALSVCACARSWPAQVAARLVGRPRVGVSLSALRRRPWLAPPQLERPLRLAGEELCAAAVGGLGAHGAGTRGDQHPRGVGPAD